MRFELASRPLLAAATAVLLTLVSPTSSTAQTDADTTRVEQKAEKPGRVKISIDKSGISIEGKANATADSDTGAAGWVEIRDERGRYKEKGLDIVKFGESVFVANDEMVRGDLVVFGGNAMIEGMVVGNVVVIGGDIRARSGAEIKGDAVVIGGDIEEDDDVVINGERVRIESLVPNIHWLPPWWTGDGQWFRLVVLPVTLFIQLILAFLVLLFLRDRVFRGDQHLSENYLKSFGVGLLSAFVGVFALIIIMIPLFITIIGIPLALLLIVSCVGVFIIAWTLFSFSLGTMVARRFQFQTDNPFLMVFIGAVLINLPSIIGFVLGTGHLSLLSPVSVAFSALGWFVKGFAYLAGLGALVLSRFGSRSPAGATPAPPAPETAGVV
jgi:hypothetical protein